MQIKKKYLTILFIAIIIFNLVFIIYYVRRNNQDYPNSSFTGNLLPTISINYPSNDLYIHDPTFDLEATCIDNDGTITSVLYWIKNTTFESTHLPLPLLSGNSYGKTIDISTNTSGAYDIFVRATDSDAEYVTKSVSVQFRIIIQNTIIASQVNYEKHNVFANEYVYANCTIHNDPTIQSLDLQVNLPSEFADAQNYEIYHLNHPYEPTMTNPSYVTLWEFDEYNAVDTMYFEIATPYFASYFTTSSTNNTNDATSYIYDIALSSYHDFYDINVSFTIEIPLIASFTAKLYQKIGINYNELDASLYNFKFVKSEFEASVSFNISQILKSETFRFRIIATELIQDEFNYEPIIYGIAIWAVASILYSVIMLVQQRFDGTKPKVLAVVVGAGAGLLWIIGHYIYLSM